MKSKSDSVTYPKVSIILPTYNRSKYLSEAIESVLNQTYSNFELIIIDDGSTDDSHKMLESITDPRLKKVFQNNKGRSSARNEGLRIAKGEYIAFIDSDDMYSPEKLMLQVNYLDKNLEAQMIYTSANCIDCEGNSINIVYRAKKSGSIYKYIAFFKPITITLPTVMLRRDILNKVGLFDEKLHRFEDTDMWRRISKVARIDALDKYTCFLRTHNENHLLSQNPYEILRSINSYIKKTFREDSRYGLKMIHKRVASLYYYYAKVYFKMSPDTVLSRLFLKRSQRFFWLYHFSFLNILVIVKDIVNSISDFSKN